MDYNNYYCTQAKSNQLGEGLPIQGINQIEPSNIEFLSHKTKINKVKRSGLRKKPKVKRRRKITTKKTKRHRKRVKRGRKANKRQIDIFS